MPSGTGSSPLVTTGCYIRSQKDTGLIVSGTGNTFSPNTTTLPISSYPEHTHKKDISSEQRQEMGKSVCVREVGVVPLIPLLSVPRKIFFGQEIRS